MRLVFGKTNWEILGTPLEAFLDRVRADGFDATEINVGAQKQPPDEVAALHRAYGLELIGQVYTEGATVADHLRGMDAQIEASLPCRPLRLNCHVGRDHFSFEDNLTLYRHLLERSRAAGVPMLAETHRGRPTFSAVETRRYLDALPELLLTADFSHWMVVHESDLSDQPEAVELAISRSRHVHARVGFEEGPQVPDPRAPEWQGHVARHVALWKRIVAHQRAVGADVMTLTPEFGPPPYQHALPFTRVPTTDVWAVNVYMRDLLRRELAA